MPSNAWTTILICKWTNLKARLRMEMTITMLTAVDVTPPRTKTIPHHFTERTVRDRTHVRQKISDKVGPIGAGLVHPRSKAHL